MAIGWSVAVAGLVWAAIGFGLEPLGHGYLLPLPLWLGASALYGMGAAYVLVVRPLEPSRGAQLAEAVWFAWLMRGLAGPWDAFWHPVRSITWAQALGLALAIGARASGGALARILGPLLGNPDREEIVKDLARIRRAWTSWALGQLAGMWALLAALRIAGVARGFLSPAEVVAGLAAATALMAYATGQAWARQVNWALQGRRVEPGLARLSAQAAAGASAALAAVLLAPSVGIEAGPAVWRWLVQLLGRVPRPLGLPAPPPSSPRPVLPRGLRLSPHFPLPRPAPRRTLPDFGAWLADHRTLLALLAVAAAVALLAARAGQLWRTGEVGQGAAPTSGQEAEARALAGSDARGRRTRLALGAVRQAMLLVLRYARRRGEGRRPGETVRSFAARVAASWEAPGRGALAALVALYEQARYAGRGHSGAVRESRRLAGDILRYWRRRPRR